MILMLRDLKQIMSRHNLVEADPNYTKYEKDMNNFGVSIDGIWNLVYSDQSIKAFLYDAKEKIGRYTITENGLDVIMVKTYYEYLPL